jgi:hypothetical protein
MENPDAMNEPEFLAWVECQEGPLPIEPDEEDYAAVDPRLEHFAAMVPQIQRHRERVRRSAAWAHKLQRLYERWRAEQN